MCGRTACTLAPDVICRACTYKDPGNDKDGLSKYKKPRWREHPPSKDPVTKYAYYGSANIAPTRFSPVMIKTGASDAVVKNEEEVEEMKQEAEEDIEREIMPMMFGMIPHYHKGEAKSHGLSTNNCRLEGLMESKLYKRVWNMRRFCVVLAQGFYEWKTVDADPKGKKQPYLIYVPQKQESAEDKKIITDNSVWENSEWSETEGWNGPEILKMAGLYDVWKSPSGDEIYSYTVITMESNDALSWLHHRMPAIFDSEEQVHAWLNATPGTDNNELLSILKPINALQWHPVDPKVGNSRCHDLDCMQPVQLQQKKTNTFMDNWLKGAKGPVKREASKVSEDDDDSSKKAKK